MHFEYIAHAASNGIAQAAASTGVPMAFGVLTTMTEEQAVERSGAGGENKGREAAAAALEMAALFRQLDEGIGG
jgi:6,7-dimethyl-8-ribityllumazine synthase